MIYLPNFLRTYSKINIIDTDRLLMTKNTAVTVNMYY